MRLQIIKKDKAWGHLWNEKMGGVLRLKIKSYSNKL